MIKLGKVNIVTSLQSGSSCKSSSLISLIFLTGVTWFLVVEYESVPAKAYNRRMKNELPNTSPCIRQAMQDLKWKISNLCAAFPPTLSTKAHPCSRPPKTQKLP